MSLLPQKMKALTEQLILQQYSPAAVLVGAEGDLLYSSARTGRYLEPAVGEASLNLFAMAREGLRTALRVAFRQALKQQATVRVRDVMVGEEGDGQAVDLMIEPLSDPKELRGMLIIVFSDVASKEPPAQARGATSTGHDGTVTALEREVLHLHSELGAAREWMQSSQEELRSANEELQSTNEALTTSKEELQSLNEELQTLNAELQSKLDELFRANSDMSNLLNATEIATVFLDRDLKVRRYPQTATRVIKLIPGDVGRPLSDLANDLNCPDLMHEAREVLRTLASSERESRTGDGRWFRVRIMPYRTLEDVIDGLVLTFIDVSVAKELEEQLRERRQPG
jgi:two-component system, chemotaxis family, CheB/CheR fusion protein